MELLEICQHLLLAKVILIFVVIFLFCSIFRAIRPLNVSLLEDVQVF